MTGLRADHYFAKWKDWYLEKVILTGYYKIKLTIKNSYQDPLPAKKKKGMETEGCTKQK